MEVKGLRSQSHALLGELMLRAGFFGGCSVFFLPRFPLNFFVLLSRGEFCYWLFPRSLPFPHIPVLRKLKSKWSGWSITPRFCHGQLWELSRPLDLGPNHLATCFFLFPLVFRRPIGGATLWLYQMKEMAQCKTCSSLMSHMDILTSPPRSQVKFYHGGQVWKVSN